jgi:hypothetical protein
LYGKQRFSEAAERWGRAALLRHAPSHAHLSHLLIHGRPGVAKNFKRGFALATAGAVLGCARTARLYSAAATPTALVLRRMQRGGLRGEEGARRRAAASGSMWLDGAKTLVMVVLRMTTPRPCDFTALQRRRGIHALSSAWAPCLRAAKVLRLTEQRPSDFTTSPPRRGMLMLSQR